MNATAKGVANWTTQFDFSTKTTGDLHTGLTLVNGDVPTQSEGLFTSAAFHQTFHHRQPKASIGAPALPAVSGTVLANLGFDDGVDSFGNSEGQLRFRGLNNNDARRCTAKDASTITCAQPADGATACPSNTAHCVFTLPAGTTQGICALSTQAECTGALAADADGTECAARKCTYDEFVVTIDDDGSSDPSFGTASGAHITGNLCGNAKADTGDLVVGAFNEWLLPQWNHHRSGIVMSFSHGVDAVRFDDTDDDNSPKIAYAYDNLGTLIGQTEAGAQAAFEITTDDTCGVLIWSVEFDTESRAAGGGRTSS